MYSTTSLCTTRCLLGSFPEQTAVVQECKGAVGSDIGSHDTLGAVCTIDAEFTRFVAGTETMLYRHAFRLCGNHAQAQDLVQSGYLKIWTSWLAHGPKDLNHQRALAYITVRHVHYDSLKKKSNMYVPTDLADYDAAGDQIVDEELIAAENAREVLKAIDQLPDTFRDLITAVYIDGATVAAFAESENIAPKTASRYHLKALKLLRGLLGEQ
ncbi:RNA polymerase sigma factor [Streptomyces microflavus]|uniref:RNA polymerase sigma factor n=1 Tax=Streptomyces microflavus TaxID=1919 RepID=UPI0036773B1D